MINKIKDLLIKTLPENTHIIVRERKNCFGGNYIMIGFAASNHLINGVEFQYPQFVSLSMYYDFTLDVQVYGGSGGNRIDRKPNMNDPKEKYLAMKGVKIPFRRPKPNEKAVLGTIEKFAQNWIKALKENKENLCYQDIVNYDDFLKNVK